MREYTTQAFAELILDLHVAYLTRVSKCTLDGIPDDEAADTAALEIGQDLVRLFRLHEVPETLNARLASAFEAGNDDLKPATVLRSEKPERNAA